MKPKDGIAMPTRENREIVECWFEDLFTRGDLQAVDELVSTVLVTYGTESDDRTAETRVPAVLR